jgi:hypothetical protein
MPCLEHLYRTHHEDQTLFYENIFGAFHHHRKPKEANFDAVHQIVHQILEFGAEFGARTGSRQIPDAQQEARFWRGTTDLFQALIIPCASQLLVSISRQVPPKTLHMLLFVRTAFGIQVSNLHAGFETFISALRGIRSPSELDNRATP